MNIILLNNNFLSVGFASFENIYKIFELPC